MMVSYKIDPGMIFKIKTVSYELSFAIWNDDAYIAKMVFEMNTQRNSLV